MARVAFLLGVVWLVGVLQITLRTAVWLEAYALDRRQQEIQRLENALAWLSAEVDQHRSPRRLADALTKMPTTLVARRELRDR